MKHRLSLLFFVGWFFTISDPISAVPGAKLVSRFGPFPSEAECRAFRTDFLDTLTAYDVVPTETSNCEKYEGA